MPARAMWKAVVRIGRLDVPVALYAAAADHTIRFRLLHRKDKEPVKQLLVDSESGEPVEPDARRKGAEVERGVYVLLDEEDLARIEPEDSRIIRIAHFVARGVLDHTWYDRPYFLGPDGNEAAYWALAEALKDSGREGIARWVMRKKEYAGSLQVRDGRLSLITLRFADQVILPEDLEISPNGKGLDDREVKMAQQLISMLEDDFDPTQYHDEFRERVGDLIEAKAKGKTFKPRKAKPEKKEQPLAEALKASLKQSKKKSNGKA